MTPPPTTNNNRSGQPKGQPKNIHTVSFLARDYRLSIASFNIENCKRHDNYLRELLDTGMYSFIGIQEHWLYHFEQKILHEMCSPTHDCAIKSVDDDDLLSPLQRPRGMGGVAICWPKNLSHTVQIHPDGSCRTLVITCKTAAVKDLCVVTSYLPARGGKGGELNFRQTLDEISEIIAKFQVDHEIILLGDWNAPLHADRGPRDISSLL